MIKLKDVLLVEDEEKKVKKLSHEVVMYVTPEVIDQDNKNNDPGCRCGKCIFFNPETSECRLTKPAKCNAEHGVCGLFLGKPKEGKFYGEPLGLIPKSDAGYIEDNKNVPTRCGNCEYYSEVGGKVSCGRVKSPIYKNGCCNKWEKKD